MGCSSRRFYACTYPASLAKGTRLSLAPFTVFPTKQPNGPELHSATCTVFVLAPDGPTVPQSRSGKLRSTTALVDACCPMVNLFSSSQTPHALPGIHRRIHGRQHCRPRQDELRQARLPPAAPNMLRNLNVNFNHNAQGLRWSALAGDPCANRASHSSLKRPSLSLRLECFHFHLKQSRGRTNTCLKFTLRPRRAAWLWLPSRDLNDDKVFSSHALFYKYVPNLTGPFQSAQGLCHVLGCSFIYFYLFYLVLPDSHGIYASSMMYSRL